MKKLILFLIFTAFSLLGIAQVPTPNPVAGITTSVCLGTVKVYGDQPIDPVANYTFSVNNGETINLITSGDQAEITWDIVGTYNVTITKTVAGCVSTATTTVIVTNNPTGTINPLTFCENDSSQPLTGTNLGNNVTFTGIGVSGTNFDPTGLAPGTYTVTATGTDANGCTVTSTEIMTINPLPTIIFNSN